MSDCRASLPFRRLLRATIVIAWCWLPPVALSAQAFHASGVIPANESAAASTAANVVVSFDALVNPSTVTKNSVKVAGRWSGPVPGTVSVAGSVVTFVPARPYFPGERVVVQVTSAVKSITSRPLTGGFSSAFWVKPKAATGAFVLDVTYGYQLPNEGPISTYGFFAGDIDRDGAPDMTAVNEDSNDIRVLRNDGCGNFQYPMTIFPLAAGSEPSPNEGADLNGDGFLDLVTGNQSSGSIAVLLNDGSGGFLAPSYDSVGGNAFGIALLDVEGDGDMDVAASNFQNVAILRNDGSGAFTYDAAFTTGIGNWQIASADFNNDGWTDLVAANYKTEDVGLLLNNGAGAFTLSATRLTGGSSPWAIGAADIDGDGNADVIVTNNASASVSLIRGDGAGGLLAATAYPVGYGPLSVDLGDFDGDADIDLSVANWASASCTVYSNAAGTLTTPLTLPAAQSASCSTVLDYDRDGDVDIVVTDEFTDTGRVYRRTEPVLPGIQQQSCGAQLRLNNYGGPSGFGGTAAVPLHSGEMAFVGISGAPGTPFILLLGSPRVPGYSTAYGILNLALTPLPLIVIDGFAGDPVGVFNAAGEAQLGALITPAFPPGFTLTLQAVTLAGANVLLSNPVRGVVVP